MAERIAARLTRGNCSRCSDGEDGGHNGRSTGRQCTQYGFCYVVTDGFFACSNGAGVPQGDQSGHPLFPKPNRFFVWSRESPRATRIPSCIRAGLIDLTFRFN
ncbi:hypothetical protein MTP99_016207 [Tenebrio molitor]|nr:hypothetical protein MTP99_016207 [Tenebrio molitor]